jgi:hypothetical protein
MQIVTRSTTVAIIMLVKRALIDQSEIGQI